LNYTRITPGVPATF